MRILKVLFCISLLLGQTSLAEEEFQPPPGGMELMFATALMKGEFRGKPYEKDPLKALALLNKSASLGFPHAPFALCVHFKKSASDFTDMVLMHEWCSVAAKIPGKAQSIASRNANEVESFVGKAAPDSLDTMRQSANKAIESFCKLNKNHQKIYSCAN